LFLDFYKSFLPDVCQQERHPECDEYIRDKEEDNFFERENPEKQHPCRL